MHVRFFAVHRDVQTNALVVRARPELEDHADDLEQHEAQDAAVDNHRADGNGLNQQLPRVAVEQTVAKAVDSRLAKIREARVKGYEGDSCGECGNFTLVRNGTCMKCNTCGSTSGCS